MIIKKLNKFKSLQERDISKASKAVVSIQENRALAHAYFNSGDPTNAYKVSIKSLSTAKKYHLNGCVIDFCRFCSYYYSVINFNNQKAEIFDQTAFKYKSLEFIELEIDLLYYKFIRNVLQKKRPTSYDKNIELTKQLLTKGKSFQICMKGYSMIVEYALLNKNYPEVIEYCTEALDYFQCVSFESTKPLEIFASRKISALLETHQLDEALFLIEQYQPQKKTFNYWKYKQFKAYYLIRSKKFEQCAQFIFQLNIKNSPTIFQEEWNIIKAYFKTFSLLKIIKKDYPFKFGKFINQNKHIIKDKSGINFNLIILEILFKYAKQDISLHDRTEAYRLYLLRHAKKTDREHILLSGLIKWINSNFSYQFEKELPKLNETPPNSVDLEIIKYQDLIGLLLETS